MLMVFICVNSKKITYKRLLSINYQINNLPIDLVINDSCEGQRKETCRKINREKQERDKEASNRDRKTDK